MQHDQFNYMCGRHDCILFVTVHAIVKSWAQCQLAGRKNP